MLAKATIFKNIRKTCFSVSEKVACVSVSEKVAVFLYVVLHNALQLIEHIFLNCVLPKIRILRYVYVDVDFLDF